MIKRVDFISLSVEIQKITKEVVEGRASGEIYIYSYLLA